MTIIDRHRRELLRAVRNAVRRFKTVRAAAKHIGMSPASLHDYARAKGIRFDSKPGPRVRR